MCILKIVFGAYVNLNSKIGATNLRLQRQLAHNRISWLQKHFQTDRVRTSKNILFHRSDVDTGQNYQNELFRSLEIIQILATTQDSFFLSKEKQLDHGRNSKHCGFVNGPILPLSLQLHW